MPTVTCKQCGKEFHVKPYKLKKGRGKFCNRACFTAWQRDHWQNENSPAWRGGISKIERECEVCGEEFTTSQQLIDKGYGRFCGIKCAAKWRSETFSGEGGSNWRGGKITITCKQCGEEFEAWVSRKRQFCSLKCMGEWQSTANLGENNPCWRGGRNSVECTCEYCGDIFYAKQAEIDKGAAKFCSRKCHDNWRSENCTGANSPRWMGGISFEPYPLTFNRRFKRMIRERDHYTCAVCRLDGNCVHHINYIKDHTNPLNCVTLCRSCHGKTGTNRPYWQSALTSLVHARHQPFYLM